jgi:hypothetical protein
MRDRKHRQPHDDEIGADTFAQWAADDEHDVALRAPCAGARPKWRKLCDWQPTFQAELTAIYREAANARGAHREGLLSEAERHEQRGTIAMPATKARRLGAILARRMPKRRTITPER